LPIACRQGVFGAEVRAPPRLLQRAQGGHARAPLGLHAPEAPAALHQEQAEEGARRGGHLQVRLLAVQIAGCWLLAGLCFFLRFLVFSSFFQLFYSNEVIFKCGCAGCGLLWGFGCWLLVGLSFPFFPPAIPKSSSSDAAAGCWLLQVSRVRPPSLFAQGWQLHAA
jgi:hypothetical protein